MKQKLLFFFLMTVFLLYGCGPRPPLASLPVIGTMVKDTAVTPEVLVMHDTIRLQIDCDQNGIGTIRPIVQQTKLPDKQGYLQVAGVKNQLLVSSTYIPPPITVRKTESIQVVEKEVDKPVPYVPRYYKFQHWVAVIMELSVAGYLALKLTRFG